MKKTKRGFTLIELLVVVLIIGILAAMALPQYQIAVAKSRYASLKKLVKSLVEAEEVYYLANGQYTETFEDLDIDMPAEKLNTSTPYNYKYNWGYCALHSTSTDAYAVCVNDKVKLQYQFYLPHAPGRKEIAICVAVNTVDRNSLGGKICQQETQHSTPTDTNTNYNFLAWLYN